MGQKFTQSDYPTQSGSQYPANIDADIKVMANLAAAYNPCAEDTPSALKVVVQAGAMFVNGLMVASTMQTITLAAADATNPRIDRIVIDAFNGSVYNVTGTPGASPTPPAIPNRALPIAQILVTAGMTVIANSAITDERMAYYSPFYRYGKCLATKTGNQTLTTGTNTILSWQLETYDTDAIHDNTTNNSRMTVPSWASEARPVVHALWAANAAGTRRLEIYKNLGTYNGMAGNTKNALTNGAAMGHRCAGEWVPVSPGDYFEVIAMQDSGGNLDIVQSAFTWFFLEVRR